MLNLKTQISNEKGKNTNFISSPNTARGKVESTKNPEPKPNKLRKSTSTEDMIAKGKTNNFHSLDARPIKKTKSKFFINNLKESKYKSAKLRNNGNQSSGKKKKWDRNVKIEKKDLKTRRAEPPKTQRNERDFVYLNVLQKSYKTITPKKLSPKVPMKNSMKNDTPLSNCNKGTTIPDILYSDLFQDLPKNSNPNTNPENKRDNGSICLNKVILLEGHNAGLSDEIKEFSPKEVCISASSKKIDNFPENSSDSNNSKKNLTPTNKKIEKKEEINGKSEKSPEKIENNWENFKTEDIIKKEEDPKVTRHNKIIEAIQNEEKQNNSLTNNDESVNVNLDETQNNNSMNESGRIKKKLPKSFVKEAFERRNKNKTGTVVEDLNNMYVNKITNNIITVPRSNSRGEKYLRQEPDEENEEKKMIRFLKERSEMANMCKIKIGNYDEAKKDD